MPRTYRRTSDRGSWSLSMLEEAVKSIQSTEKTIGEAAKYFQVPKTTLYRHLRHKNIKEAGVVGGRCPVLSKDFEDQLVQHIKEMQRIMFGLTPKDVRRLAFQLAEKNKLKHMFSQKTQMAGEDWFLSFCKRHQDLSVRRPEATSMNRAIGFNRQRVTQFNNILEVELKNNNIDASNIWNVDESGLTSVHKPPKIVAVKGMKQVGKLTSGERGRTITIICSFNAAGSYIPPVLFFPRKIMTDRLMKGAPPNSVGFASASGWVNEELFVLWLEHFVKHAKPSKEQKHIIILDGHSSQKSLPAIDYAREHGVILISLPPHTTHRMQPLDLVFYGPLKNAYNRQADSWMTSNPGKRITDYEVAEIFGHEYTRIGSIENGVSGFAHSGIFPFNPDKFTDGDFATLHVERQSETSISVIPENHDVASVDPDTTTMLVTVNSNMSSIGEHSNASAEPSSTQPINSPNPSEIVLQIPVESNDGESSDGLVQTVQLFVSVNDISPMPTIYLKESEKKRKRIPEIARVLTSTPVKLDLQQKMIDKKSKKRVTTVRTKGSVDHCAQPTNSPSGSRPRSKCKRSLVAESADTTVTSQEVYYCIYCSDQFFDPPSEPWVQCSVCLKWCHESCVINMKPPLPANFACTNCKPKRKRC